MFQINLVLKAIFRTILMIDLRFFSYMFHISVIAIILKLLNVYLATWIVNFYLQLAYLSFLLIISHFTYDFVKNLYLTERVNPVNKAVLITGCDSGFGHLLAERLDAKGYSVFASCLSANGEGALQLQNRCSKRLKILELDVTRDESVENALHLVEKQLEHNDLWAIVNNAGVHKGFDTEFCTMKDFKDSMEVNAIGMVRVTKAFLPLLRKSKGRVVNVTSLTGRFSFSRACPYIISKYAAVGFTECLRQEMEVWGLRVISIEPELFKTAIANPKLIAEQLEASIHNLKENIRRDYGESFFPSYKLWMYRLLSKGSKQYHLVIDDLESAICLKYPDSVYKPRRNFYVRILLYFAENMPRKLLDMIICFVAYFFGLPTPDKAMQTFSK